MTTAFRVIIGLLALLIVYSGVDTAFGGFQTLGLQGIPAFWEVTDQAIYDKIYSHQHLRGGIWMGVGVLLAYGAVRTDFRVIQLMLIFVVIGGLSRFAQGRLDIMFGDLLFVVAIELIIAPALLFAIQIINRKEPSDA